MKFIRYNDCRFASHNKIIIDWCLVQAKIKSSSYKYQSIIKDPSILAIPINNWMETRTSGVAPDSASIESGPMLKTNNTVEEEVKLPTFIEGFKIM